MDMFARMVEVMVVFETEVTAATVTDANDVHGVNVHSGGNGHGMDGHRVTEVAPSPFPQ